MHVEVSGVDRMSEVFLGYVTNLQEATAFGIFTTGLGKQL